VEVYKSPVLSFIEILSIQDRFMRNRINRMKTYRLQEQAPSAKLIFHGLAIRIWSGTEQIQNFICARLGLGV
jgi:hypothetical protein